MARQAFELDRLLASVTRAFAKVRGVPRLATPLRHFYSRHYGNHGDSWVWIKSYRGGLKLCVDRAAYMGSAIYWYGWHHKAELDFLESTLENGATFIDVGANIGEFTVPAAARVGTAGKVLAFEPSGEVRKRLQESLLANGLSNTDVLPFALGEQEGELELFTSLDKETFHGKHEGLYTAYPDSYRNVSAGSARVSRLDKIIEERKITSVDLIKIDVEGGEWSVLKGGTKTLRRFQPMLIIELNEMTFQNAGYSTTQLLTWLENVGYKPLQFSVRKRLKADIAVTDDLICNVLFDVFPKRRHSSSP